VSFPILLGSPRDGGEEEISASEEEKVSVKRTILFALTSVLMIGAIGKRGAAASRETEKAAIAKLINDSICWALTKDRALQESTMAHDEDLFIFWTKSNSTIVGWNQYVKLFDTYMDPRFKATLTEVRDLRVNISRSGDVAWFSATLDDLGEWDGKPRGARDIRWTGVLEKRKGRWVIVQEHGSVAADRVPEQPTHD
jgi:ketosteroid isomerase-like protein